MKIQKLKYINLKRKNTYNQEEGPVAMSL